VLLACARATATARRDMELPRPVAPANNVGQRGARAAPSTWSAHQRYAFLQNARPGTARGSHQPRGPTGARRRRCSTKTDTSCWPAPSSPSPVPGRLPETEMHPRGLEPRRSALRGHPCSMPSGPGSRPPGRLSRRRPGTSTTSDRWVRGLTVAPLSHAPSRPATRRPSRLPRCGVVQCVRVDAQPRADVGVPGERLRVLDGQASRGEV
jgi:hypothetical protein